MISQHLGYLHKMYLGKPRPDEEVLPKLHPLLRRSQNRSHKHVGDRYLRDDFSESKYGDTNKEASREA